MVIGILLCASLTSILAFIFPKASNAVLNYDSIFVIIQASLMFAVFLKINIRSGLINAIAKTVFGVYLLHYPFAKKIAEMINMEKLCSSGVIQMLLCCIIVVGLTFIICAIMDMMIRLVIRPVGRSWKKTKLYSYSVTPTI